MRELSLHINDIVENSIQADATLINILIHEDHTSDLLTIKIVDNGKGIPEEKLRNITDPFETSRTTRRVGLGLSLLEAAAKRCEGSLQIRSNTKGTEVTATFKHSHIDRAPVGNMVDTLLTIIISLKDNTDLVYEHRIDDKAFTFDTREVRSILGKEIPLNQLEVLSWIKDTIHEELLNLTEV